MPSIPQAYADRHAALDVGSGRAHLFDERMYTFPAMAGISSSGTCTLARPSPKLSRSVPRSHSKRTQNSRTKSRPACARSRLRQHVTLFLSVAADRFLSPFPQPNLVWTFSSQRLVKRGITPLTTSYPESKRCFDFAQHGNKRMLRRIPLAVNRSDRFDWADVQNFDDRSNPSVHRPAPAPRR